MQILTVSDAMGALKALIGELSNDLWLAGEVSGCKRYESGHYYFTLKDKATQIRCVLFRREATRQTHLPRDGSAFLMHGYFSVYEERGELQFYVNMVQPGGVGKLHLEYEALKRRLEDEGLFDPERKRPLPLRPQTIGIVTSPQAAAYQDILKVLGRRYPLGQVILAPTLVQGENAPAQIKAAIETLNHRKDIDVIIVARGGGSIEELWAFNDERVARAVFASRIPIITGVGHETDYTIVDYIADMRAPTPSAAAELVAPDLNELRQEISALRDSLAVSIENQLDQRRNKVDDIKYRLQMASPLQRLSELRQQISTIQKQANLNLKHTILLHKAEIRSIEGRLVALNPKQILARGYAIVTDETAQVVTSVEKVQAGNELRIQVSDGQFKVRIT
jgi:exodeoxyribonuclease VII large subunit